MTWQMRDPFGEGIATAIGAYGGVQQAKQNQAALEYERKRQLTEDAQAAALNASTISKNSAEVSKSASDTSRADAEAGVGLKPFAPLLNHGKKPTSRELANYYAQGAAYYTSNKATKLGDNFAKLAKQYSDQADKEDAAKLSWAKERNAEIETQARIHHWSAQELQAAKDAVDKLSIAASHDQTTLAAASMHVAATIQAANINADSRWRVTNLEEQGRNRRAKDAQAGLNARDYVNQKNQSARETAALGAANPKAPPGVIPVYGGVGSPQSGKNIPNTVKTLIQQAIRNGHPASDIIRAPEVKSYNLTEQDINAIGNGGR